MNPPMTPPWWASKYREKLHLAPHPSKAKIAEKFGPKLRHKLCQLDPGTISIQEYVRQIQGILWLGAANLMRFLGCSLAGKREISTAIDNGSHKEGDWKRN